MLVVGGYLFTQRIREKMAELAQGQFTYTPTKEVSPALISDIYNSGPLFFGLMGNVISRDQGSLSDFPLPMPIDPQNKVYLLISQNGAPVALLNCIVDYPGKDIVLLAWLIVHGQHLFQGIGRANYQFFCEAVSSLGMKQIHIRVEAQNQATITFWEGLGFKQISASEQSASAYNSDCSVCIEYYLDLKCKDKITNPE